MNDIRFHSGCSGRSWLSALVLGLLVACSSGGGATGFQDGPGQGGGPGEPGPGGNPLDIVLDFEVQNDSAVERTETIRVSVPFPKGGYPSLANLIVSGHQTAWLPLQYWPDGTIKVAQAQFTDTLAANQVKSYSIARDEPALNGPFTRNAWVEIAGGGLQLGAEVRDTFSVDYRAVATGEGELLQESPLVRVRRWRGYHMPLNAPGIGRDYLSSTWYVSEFRDMPLMLVDWVVGNDYLGTDQIPAGNTNPNLRPLGAVDVKRLRFLCKGMSGVRPYLPATEGISNQTAHGDGFTAFEVMSETYLDDAQTRRYRFLLRFEPANADPLDVARWRDIADAMLQKPFFPLATQRTWEDTSAVGLLGGPVAGPSDAPERAQREYAIWRDGNHFGTWGTRSDVLVTGTTGTPRNHPLSPELAHAIQGHCQKLVQKLEQMAWIQAARPYHLWNLHVGAEQLLLLWDGVPIYPGSRDLSHESLGRRALYANDPYAAYRNNNRNSPRAHGWQHFDHEHFSMDLLFDYWTVSGDAWAKEEIRQLGESLKGLMRLRNYYTAEIQAARAEGWCMQGFAQTYQVTRDPSMKAYAMRRVSEVVDPQRMKNHPSKALVFIPNYPGSQFPLNHKFIYAWQHGALLYGFLGAYRCFEEPLLLQICEDVVTMVEYCWVTNYNDPVRGLVPQGLRYFCPVEYNGTPIPPNYWDNTPGIGVRWGDSPLGGAHTFLTGSLLHLALETGSPAVRDGAVHYAGLLLGSMTPGGRWNKWEYCIPKFYAEHFSQ